MRIIEDIYGANVSEHCKCSFLRMPYFSPQSRMVLIWECFVAAISFLSTMLTIFQGYIEPLCSSLTDAGPLYKDPQSGKVTSDAVCFDTSVIALWGFQYFFDVVFILNIFSRFCIGFKTHGIIITDPSAIRERYFRSWLLVDVLSVIPFEFLKLIFTVDYIGFGPFDSYSRTNRMLNILRFFSLMSSLSQEPGVNKLHLSTIYYSCLFSLLLHTCSCTWYALACTPTHFMEKRQCEKNNSWPILLVNMEMDVENMSIFESYLVSVYWSGVTLTLVGYGDIHAMNSFEALVSILVVFLGLAVVNGMIMTGISSFVTIRDSQRGLYHEQLQAIKNNMNDIGLSLKTQEWVIGYYIFLWNHYRGYPIESLMDDLPYSLYSEIKMELCQEIFTEIEMFQNLDKGFQRALSVAFCQYAYSCGQFLIRKQQIKRSFYWLEHGLLQIKDSSTDDTIATLLPRCSFGDVDLILGIPKNINICAATTCEMLVLKSEKLQKLFLDYPNAAKTFLRIARLRCYNVMHTIRDAFDVIIALHPKYVIFHKDLRANLKPHDQKIFKLHSQRFDRYTENMKAEIMTLLSKNEQKRFWQKTILPNSLFVHRWKFFVVACQTLAIFLLTWVICFTNNADSQGFWFMEFGALLLSIACIIDIIFVADILLRLRTEVPSADGYLADFQSIFHNYVQSREIYYDVASVLPLDIFSVVHSGLYHWKLIGILRINRLLWCRTILKLFYQYESDLQKNPVHHRFIKCFLILLLSTHICAGLFYLSGCFSKRCDARSWVTYRSHKNQSNIFHYVTAIYWATTTMTASGTGDITAYNTKEQIAALFCCIVGIFMYNYIISEISATLASAQIARVDFQNRLSAMIHFMKSYDLHYSLQKRVSDYMCLLWNENQGQAYPGGPLLMSDLPPELQQDVLMKERGTLLKKVPFFSETEDDLILDLAAVSKLYFYPPGEVIQYRETISRELFCVRKGKCQVPLQQKLLTRPMYANKNDTPPQYTTYFQDKYIALRENLIQVVATFSPGIYFGEVGFLFTKPATFTVSAKTDCQVLILDYKQVEDVLLKYPIIEKQMNNLCKCGNYYSALRTYAINLRTLRPTNENLCCYSHHCKESRYGDNITLPILQETQETAVNYKCTQSKLDYLISTIRGSLWLSYLKCFCPRFLMKQAFCPDNHLLVYWEIFRLVIAIAISIITSTQIAFLYLNVKLWIVSYVLDVVCWIDMYLHFHVAYYQDGKLVTHTLLTANHYLQTNFILDLISCFPWELFALAKYSPSINCAVCLQLYTYCRMPHLLQLYRLPLACKYWQFGIATIKLWHTFLLFFIYNALFLHFCTCIVWIFTCSLTVNYTPDDKYYILGNTGYYCQVDSWFSNILNSYDLVIENMTFEEVFTFSLYFTTQMVSNVAFGDVYASSFQMELLTTILMIIGAVFYGWAVGVIISIIVSEDAARTRFADDIHALKVFFKYQNISAATYGNVVKFYSYKWKRTKGIEPESIFEFLPSALHGDITYMMHADIIAKVFGMKICKPPQLNNNKPKKQLPQIYLHLLGKTHVPILQSRLCRKSIHALEENQCFIKMLVKCVRPCLFQANAEIMRRNDIGEEMFYIKKGEVFVLSQDEQRVIAKLSVGDYFGEWSLMFREPRKATVRAATDCDLYTLAKTDVEDVLQHFPDIYKEFSSTAIRKKENAVRRSIRVVPVKMPSASCNHRLACMTMYNQLLMVNKDDKKDDKKIWRSWTPEFPHLRVLHMCSLLIKYHSFTFDLENNLWIITQYICCAVILASFWSLTYVVALGDIQTTVYISSEVCEIILILQVFFKFHIRCYGEPGTYVNLYITASQLYLKKRMGFIYDMICAFPVSMFALQYFEESDVSQSLKYLSRANMIHILRIINVFIFINEEEKKITSNLLLVRFLKCTTYLTLYAHLSALCFIYTACPDSCYIDSWLSFLPMFSKVENSPTENVYSMTLQDIYINAFYWVLSCLTTGFGNIHAKWHFEIWMTIVVIFVGKFISGYIVGIFSATQANFCTLQVSFEEKLKVIKNYMVRKQISPALQKRVIRFYNYLFARTNGVDHRTLFNGMPTSMKRDIFARIGLDLLKKQWLFNQLPWTFLEELSTKLIFQHFTGGEYLIMEGDVTCDLFLILNGKVLVSSEKEECPVNKLLTSGEAYGMQSIFVRELVQDTLQAQDYVDVLTLSKPDFEEVLLRYPEVEQNIQSCFQSEFHC